MRHPRLSTPRQAVVLVAHGSRDPRAAASTEALARAVRRAYPRWSVHAAYLDHAGPRPLEVLSSLPAGTRAVIVPLLLTSAYHGRVDVPAIVSSAAGLPIDVRVAPVLGPEPGSRGGVSPQLGRESGSGGVSPLLGRESGSGGVSPQLGSESSPRGGVSPLLIDGLVRQLSAVVPVASLDGVVLAAAGTRDLAARETITWARDALSARLSLPCAVAYASAAPPSAGEAVARLQASAGASRIAMATYFLAPGYLYDLAVSSASEAGAVAAASPLGDVPELVRLIATRVETAAATPLASAA